MIVITLHDPDIEKKLEETNKLLERIAVALEIIAAPPPKPPTDLKIKVTDTPSAP